MNCMLRSIWQYRNFILSSIRNELLTRFARSKLGGLWMIINPLSQVAIYALVLSNVLSAKLHGIDNKYAYAIYLMAGLLAWNLFSEVVDRCLNLFIAHGELLKKLNFPRIALPCIVVGSSLLNNIFLFAAMLGVFILLGHQFSNMIFWLLPITLVLLTFSLGIGLILGIINVFLRDLGQVVPILLQVWFWFTPIVYPEKIIPLNYRWLLKLNPMYHIINAYQQVLAYDSAPEIGGITIISAFAVGIMLLSLFLFRRAGAEMVDVL